MKKITAVFLSVIMLLSSLSYYTFAAEPCELLFEVSVDGENEVYVNAGDSITVDFTVKNLTDSNTFTITNLQNEIEYDTDFFEFTEGDVELVTATSSRHADDYSWGAKRVQLLALHVSGGNAKVYDNTQLVARVTFKVKEGLANGTSGKLVNKVCEAADGISKITYQTSSKGMTVYIGSEQQEEKFTVTYMDGDRVIYTDSSATAGSVINIYSAPDAQGRKFRGWEDESGNIWQTGDDFTITDNVTFKAVWSEKYILSFDTDGGSEINNVIAWESESIDLSAYIPVKNGYVFDGWYTDKSFAEKITSISLSTNTTVYAKWSEMYTLTFNTNGGQSIAPITEKPGTVINLSEYTAERSGYTFTGWYSDASLKTTVTSITLTQNTTVYAGWKSNSVGGGGGVTKKYEITFDTNGGTGIQSIVNSENATIDLTVYVPAKDGYVFDGWYTDKDFTNKVTEIKLVSDITLFAKWSVKEPQDTNESNKPGILTDEHYAYIVGREGGLIAPESDITRAEVATIIYRLLDEEVRNNAKTQENVFTDVNENDWFNTAVSTLASLKLVNGRTTDTFAPNAFITRAELATIFARMVEIEHDGKVLFSDVSGHWAESYINEAATAEWIVGYNGLFRPNDNITRAETMTLVNRVLDRVPESIDDLHKDMKTWADNADTKAWYYIAVQEATNSHKYTRKQDGIHEAWISLAETPDWTVYEK